MPKLPRLSGAQVIKALENLGFRQLRQRGSHVILKKASAAGDIGCVVPIHDELKTGTLRGILRMARVSLEDFLRQL